MQFHWPSFLLGYGSGLATALFADRLRPVLVELGSMVQQLLDSAGTAVAAGREDFEDAVAEAKARATRASPDAAETKEKHRPARPRRSPVRRSGAIRAVSRRR